MFNFQLFFTIRIRAKPAESVAQEFNDSTYQAHLPPYARATKTRVNTWILYCAMQYYLLQSIKNNLAITEYVTEPDRNHCANKVKIMFL